MNESPPVFYRTSSLLGPLPKRVDFRLRVRRRRRNFPMCESIGHRPLRDRCPSNHLMPTYTHLGVTGTTDYLMLLRPLHLWSVVAAPT